MRRAWPLVESRGCFYDCDGNPSFAQQKRSEETTWAGSDDDDLLKVRELIRPSSLIMNKKGICLNSRRRIDPRQAFC